jgi:hypothetical protein
MANMARKDELLAADNAWWLLMAAVSKSHFRG